jgi:hypothetical protein
VAVEPVDLGAGQEEAVGEQLQRPVGRDPVDRRVQQELQRQGRRALARGALGDPGGQVAAGAVAADREPAGSAPSRAALPAAQGSAAQASATAAGKRCSGAGR